MEYNSSPDDKGVKMKYRYTSLVRKLLITGLLVGLIVIFYGPIKRNFFTEEGIHLTIDNQVADIDRPLDVIFKNSEEQHFLYSEHLVKHNKVELSVDRPFRSEGSIAIRLGDQLVYTIGYIDASISRVFIQIKVTGLNNETGEVSFRIKVFNGPDRMVERVKLKLDSE